MDTRQIIIPDQTFDEALANLEQHIKDDNLSAARSTIVFLTKHDKFWYYLNDNIGFRMLKYAVMHQQVDIAKDLMQAGVNAYSTFNSDVDQSKRASMISLAVASGNLEMVKLFVACDAHKQSSRLGGTDNLCLRVAIEAGNDEITEYLLVNGADPDGLMEEDIDDENLPDHIPHSFLTKVLSDSKHHLATLLIQNGADVKKMITYAYWAYSHSANKQHVRNQYESMIKNIMDYAVGVDFTKSDDDSDNEHGLSFLNGVDLTGINLVGVSQNGKPLTHEMLSELGFDHADKAIVTIDDLNNVSDVDRKARMTNQVNCHVQTLGRLVNHQGVYNFLPLWLAAKAGDLDAVKARLTFNNDPNKYLKRYTHSPIEHAAEHGHLDVVKLLAVHPNIDKQSIVEANKVAIRNGYESISLYLSSLTDINARGLYGCTLLHNAVSEANVNEVERLIGLGADVNMGTNQEEGSHWETPLALATSRLRDQKFNKVDMTAKYGSIIRLLLNHGADPDKCPHRNKNYDTSNLHYAARSTTSEAVKLLLPHIRKDHVDIYDYNDHVISHEPWYLSSMFEAALHLNVEILVLLKANGADFNVTYGGCTLLTRILKTSILPNELMPVVKYLLNNGADINLKDAEGNSPLHILVNHLSRHEGIRESQKVILREFLKHGAEVNAKNNKDETPIRLAINDLRNLDTDVFDLLISHGANPLSVSGDAGPSWAYLKKLCQLTNQNPAIKDLLKYIQKCEEVKVDRGHVKPAIISMLGKLGIYKTPEVFDKRLAAAKALKNVLLNGDDVVYLERFSDELNRGPLKKIYHHLSKDICSDNHSRTKFKK